MAENKTVTRRRLLLALGASTIPASAANKSIVSVCHIPSVTGSAVLLLDKGRATAPDVLGVAKGVAFTFRAQQVAGQGCTEWIKDIVVGKDSTDAQNRRDTVLKLTNGPANYVVKGCCLSSAQVNIYTASNDPAKPDFGGYFTLVSRARKDVSTGKIQFQPDEIWISKTSFDDSINGYVRAHMEAICDATLP